MAPLTWRNVDSPSFAGANDMWKTAAALMNSGIDQARKGISDFRDTTTDAQSAALMQQVIGAGNDPAAIAAAAGAANPAYVSPQALAFANNQAGVLLDREGKQLSNTGEGIQNTIRTQSVRANDYNFDRTQLDNQRADQRYAMMPEAISAMTGLRSQIANGQLNPEQSAAAQQEFLSKYGQTLGVTDAQSVGAFFSGSLDAQNKQQNANIGNLQYAAGMDDMVRKQDAKGIAANILGMVNNDPDQAIRAAKQFKNLDPETVLATISQIETYRGALSQKTAAESMLEGGTLFNDKARPNITLPDTYKPVIMNNGGKRNLPLNSNLNKALSDVLPNLGITAVVTSGGQVTKEEAAQGKGQRTGSTRHDHGGAADIKMQDAATGRTLSWERPADVPKLQAAVAGLKGAGLTGFGAAGDYMGDTTTHVGYGKPSVWGAKGGKPYQALMDAYNGATSKVQSTAGPTIEKAAAANAAPQYEAAMNAINNNQSYNAPIDSAKVQIQNGDGSVSTERTFTTEIGGAWFNIPSIVAGKQLPEEEALAQFKAGTNPAVGVFQNKREAEGAAATRSENIGKMLESAVADKDAASTATTQETNANLTSQLVQPAVNAPATTATSAPVVAAETPAPTRSTPAATNDPTQEIKVGGGMTIPAIDPSGSQASQDAQSVRRNMSIDGVVENIKKELGTPLSSLAGSAWDYFMESPDTAKQNNADREGAAEALDFFKSENAQKYFRQNPQALVAAKADPVKFAREFAPATAAPVPADTATTSTGSQTQAQIATQTVASRTRNLNAAESVEQAFAAVGGTQSIDAANDQFPGLRKAIGEARSNEETAAQVAARLTKADGTLAAYTAPEVTAAIQQISDEIKIKPSVAAALLEEKGNYDKGFFGIGKGYELDIGKMKELYKTYQEGANPKAGVSNLVNAEMSKYQATQVTNLQKEVSATQEALKAAIADPNTPPEKVMDYTRRLAQLPDIVKARLANILAAGNTDANIRTKTDN